MVEKLDEGEGDLGILKYFSLLFFSILWSIWTYKNKTTVKKEPFYVTVVVLYFKCVIPMCRVTNPVGVKLQG